MKGVCRQELDQVQAQEANLLELFPARQWKDAIHFEHKPRSSLFMISVMTKWFKKNKMSVFRCHSKQQKLGELIQNPRGSAQLMM